MLLFCRYISTLFSHAGWPNAINCKDFANELKEKYSSSILSHFHTNFLKIMSEKRTSGQPVALTDLFGMAIGDALLDVSCLKYSWCTTV